MHTTPGNQQTVTAFLKSRNLRILLVDDNRVNQFLGKRILQNIGVTNVELASDGDEAFSKIIAGEFDVLLTDVEMPGKSGYELSKALHSTIAPEKMPLIIALTANASDEDREQAKQAGISGYLTKPYSPQDLMDILFQHFGSENVLILEDMTLSTVQKSHSSLQKVYEVFHSNREDIQHFLLMLSQQLPQLIQEIKQGIALDDWDKAFQAAHKLKSPVTLLGNSFLAGELGKLTEDLRNRERLQDCPAAFDNLLPDLESMLVLVNTELEKQG
jgi:CheY-like chemotaxis protein